MSHRLGPAAFMALALSACGTERVVERGVRPFSRVLEERVTSRELCVHRVLPSLDDVTVLVKVRTEWFRIVEEGDEIFERTETYAPALEIVEMPVAVVLLPLGLAVGTALIPAAVINGGEDRLGVFRQVYVEWPATLFDPSRNFLAGDPLTRVVDRRPTRRESTTREEHWAQPEEFEVLEVRSHPGGDPAAGCRRGEGAIVFRRSGGGEKAYRIQVRFDGRIVTLDAAWP